METLKKYLTRRGIPFRKQYGRMMIFSGNHMEGIYIDSDKMDNAIWNYLRRHWDTLRWAFRAHYETVYITPAVQGVA